ncbi:MAG TPA: K(+)-transporting ATPase subunit F [Polyangiales bacterium]|nr:K(+)-transporting ATPase subunit F [Polyangiales bacterium]
MESSMADVAFVSVVTLLLFVYLLYALLVPEKF